MKFPPSSRRPAVVIEVGGETPEVELAARRLAEYPGRDIFLVPPLVDLPDDDPLWQTLRDRAVPIVVCSGFHERAVRALLASRWSRGADSALPPDLSVIRLTDHRGRDAAAIAAAIAEAAPGAPGSQSVLFDRSRPAPPPRWYPIIDPERCVRCGQCWQFCIFGVYERKHNGTVLVVQPDACKPGCPACARICPVQAVIFPRCPDDPIVAGAEPPAAPESFSAGDAPAPPPSCPTTDALDDLIRRLDELDT